MSLGPCRECGKQVSTEATTCPHCGAPAVRFPIWQQFKKEAGWVAFILAALAGQATITGVLTAVTKGPALDAHGWDLFLGLFVVTAPLTVAAVIFFGLAFADQLKTGPHAIGAGAACLIGGLIIGKALGNASAIALDQTPMPNYGGGPWGAARTILWFLGAYYQVYGWATFVSSIILGAFLGSWAARLIHWRQGA